MANDFQRYVFPQTGFSDGSPIVNTQSPTGDILGSLATAAVGSLAGNAINFGFNSMLQNNQFENQKKLMDRAAQKNAAAVAQQARLQAQGMQNAGLSPANVNGAGAPSVQAGAAAGATSQMSNIFSGLAELVQAIKAPTEIEKAAAEAGLAGSTAEKTRAETDTLIPAQVSNLFASTGKLSQEIRSMKNMNDVYEAQLKFVKEQGPAVIEGNNAMLKAAGVWNKLPPKTQDTLSRMADGTFDIGLGELEGLRKVVDEQANLMTKDKELFTSALDTIVAMNQIQDKSVLSALQNLPLNQQNLMRAEISEYYALANQASTQADLNKLNKWLEEHNSDQWLVEHGMSDEIERKKYIELLNQILHFPSAVANSVPYALGGTLAGKAASSGFHTPPDVGAKAYKYFR